MGSPCSIIQGFAQEGYCISSLNVFSVVILALLLVLVHLKEGDLSHKNWIWTGLALEPWSEEF